MEKLLTIGFEYCKKLYHSVIMVKKKSGQTIYQITVMNGELEKLLYGNHRIREINGCLQIEVGRNIRQEMLKLSIAEALGKVLGIPLKKKFGF